MSKYIVEIPCEDLKTAKIVGMLVVDEVKEIKRYQIRKCVIGRKTE